MTNTYWNAEVYDRIGKPMRRWAQQVIDDLGARGRRDGARRRLRLRLRHVRPAREAAARQDLRRRRLGGDDRVALEAGRRTRRHERRAPMIASLTDFTLPEPVDAVFSNAVFHWIPDDDALFGCLYRAAKPGGRLRAQCGGYGNNAHVLEAVAAVRERAALRAHLGGFSDSKKYRTPEDAKASLERAGWRDVRASLFESPQPFEDRRRSGALRPHDPAARPRRALPESRRHRLLAGRRRGDDAALGRAVRRRLRPAGPLGRAHR